MSSTDGITWTSRTASASVTWRRVDYQNDRWVAASSAEGTGLAAGIMTAPGAGDTWTTRTTDGYGPGALAYGNGRHVALGKSPTWGYSTDGTSWTRQTNYSANSNDQPRQLRYSNGMFVSVGHPFSYHSYTSTDGITWTPRSMSNNIWQGLAYGNGIWVAVGSGWSVFGIPGGVATSTDGTTWTDQTPSQTNAWNGVAYGNGTFVAVSSDGTNRVMTSTNGTTWTARSAAEANEWRSVAYRNGLFVAVSSTGTNRVMTSTDGITWTSRTASLVGWQEVAANTS